MGFKNMAKILMDYGYFSPFIIILYGILTTKRSGFLPASCRSAFRDHATFYVIVTLILSRRGYTFFATI